MNAIHHYGLNQIQTAPQLTGLRPVCLAPRHGLSSQGQEHVEEEMRIGIVLLAALGLVAPAQAQPGQTAAASGPESPSLTLYPGDVALVRERRSARLPGGLARLQVGGIPARIRPETAMLQADSNAGLKLLELRHDPGRLSLQTLLEQHVGREVGVLGGPPGGAAPTVERAILLSVQGGILLRFPGRIGTAAADRIVFDDLPAGLDGRPTIDALLESLPGLQALDLAYQTGGLSWHADYVALLSADGRSLDLSGWATIGNRSGADFHDARLQLVAGAVNRVQEAQAASERIARASVMSAAGAPAEEALLDYHLYRYERPVTLRDQQTLQLALLPVTRVPVRREYLISDLAQPYPERQDGGAQQLRPVVMLEFVNPGGQPGKPLPAGTVRVHAPDQQDALQLVGEDRIPHVAVGETVRLRLGSAFDLPAERRQIAYRKLSDNSSESSWRLNLRNAGTQAATVKLQENIPGDWTLVQSSHPGRQESAHVMAWTLTVPAGGTTQLDYTVRQRW